jgi:hypothetical protein
MSNIEYPLQFPDKVSPESLIDVLLIVEEFCKLNNLTKEKEAVDELHTIIWETL